MRGAASIAACAVVALTVAACGPSAGVSAAVAEPALANANDAAAMLHPAVAEDAADGAVFEYH